MGYRFSLAYLTVFDATPPEAIKIAAQCGYTHVGVRLLPASTEGPFPLLSDNALLAETKAVMADTGVKVADIEIIRIGEHFNPAATEAFLARGAELGASNILVAGDDEDYHRCTDNYAKFCQLAAQYGMTADLEFMPWTKVPDLTAAKQIVEQANQPNAGILIDALHFDRSSTTLEQIATLDPSLIHYVQFCDGLKEYDPAHEQLIAIARGQRLNPGEGGIDLKGLLNVIPKDTVLSLEIPHLERARIFTPLERARAAMDAIKLLIEEAAI